MGAWHQFCIWLSYIYMGRRMRIIISNSIYHVSDRINNHNRWFEEKDACELYLAFLYEQKLKNKFKIFSFCLMPTHNHQIIQTDDRVATLDEVMHDLNGGFAKIFHKLKGERGRFWSERYSSRPLLDEKELWMTLKYIADNPVKAELVKDPLDYEYNSIRNLQTGDFQYILDPLPHDLEERLIQEYKIFSRTKMLSIGKLN